MEKNCTTCGYENEREFRCVRDPEKCPGPCVAPGYMYWQPKDEKDCNTCAGYNKGKGCDECKRCFYHEKWFAPEPTEVPVTTATEVLVNKAFAEALAIVRDRNASYGDAWKDYRISTYIDRAVVKTKRLRNLDEQGEAKEKMLDQALDLINEMAFLVIKLRGW